MPGRRRWNMGEYKINIVIREEENAYNPFDPSGETISDDVKSYLQEKFRDRSIGDKIKLHIISEEQIDEEKFKKALHLWIEKEAQRNRKERQLNNIQMLRMLIIGAVFIAVSIALEIKVGVIWYTILSTIGAFSMWEAASYWLVKNPKLKHDKLVIRKLSDEVDIYFE